MINVVLSRKGFDSGTGGNASILLDNKLHTLPIPIGIDENKYTDVKSVMDNSLFDLMQSVGIKRVKEGSTYKDLDSAMCHLDPDIDYQARKRPEGRRGAFGQCDAAQSHLQERIFKDGVLEPTIFLFFGWFREADLEKRKLLGEGKHILFGYLEAEKYYDCSQGSVTEDLPIWLNNNEYRHPHTLSDRTSKKMNGIYVAREESQLVSGKRGYGLFEFPNRSAIDEVVLSKDGETRSKWKLNPAFKDLHGKLNISYHSANSWKDDYFQSAARGQEFVIEKNQLVTDQVAELIRKYGPSIEK